MKPYKKQQEFLCNLTKIGNEYVIHDNCKKNILKYATIILILIINIIYGIIVMEKKYEQLFDFECCEESKR